MTYKLRFSWSAPSSVLRGCSDGASNKVEVAMRDYASGSNPNDSTALFNIQDR